MDKEIKEIIKEIAQEEGISRERVEYSVRHACNWIRSKFINLDYPEIKLPYFGTFKLMPNRVKEPLRAKLEKYYDDKRVRRKH